MTNLPKTIEEILGSFGASVYSNGELGISKESALNKLTQAITTWALEMVGEDEKMVKLPVMQIQEQNNYDKEQRNELRAELRQCITQSMGEGV